jgi:hypothetical protein
MRLSLLLFCALAALHPRDVAALHAPGHLAPHIHSLHAARQRAAAASPESVAPPPSFRGRQMPFSHLFPSAAKSHIRNGTFTQPLDHFDGSTNVTFEQRFWYTLEHLDAKRKPDSVVPLIVYDGGETSGDNRLSNLRSGVVNDIARAVQGIPIILEVSATHVGLHRTAGRSTDVRRCTSIATMASPSPTASSSGLERRGAWTSCAGSTTARRSRTPRASCSS